MRYHSNAAEIYEGLNTTWLVHNSKNKLHTLLYVACKCSLSPTSAVGVSFSRLLILRWSQPGRINTLVQFKQPTWPTPSVEWNSFFEKQMCTLKEHRFLLISIIKLFLIGTSFVMVHLNIDWCLLLCFTSPTGVLWLIFFFSVYLVVENT